MDEMNDEVIMSITVDDLRDLTPQEKQDDAFRRMFQMLGLIYKNQIDIINTLAINKGT